MVFSQMYRPLVWLLTTTFLTSSISHNSAYASPLKAQEMIYNWSSVCIHHVVISVLADGVYKIMPSTSLTWTPCFENFTCTRLKVPLDYSNLDLGNTTIAIIKLAAQDGPEPANSILVNTGTIA